MDGGRHVRELDEVLQVLERAVAAAAIEIVDERRPADRRENGRIAAEAHVALGVARMQRELARRRLEQMARESARDVHPLALDVGAGAPPQAQGFRVAPKLDADLLEDGLGVVLDDLDRLGTEQFDRRQLAADVGIFGGLSAGTRQARLAAAARRCWIVVHGVLALARGASGRIARARRSLCLGGGPGSMPIERTHDYSMPSFVVPPWNRPLLASARWSRTRASDTGAAP